MTVMGCEEGEICEYVIDRKGGGLPDRRDGDGEIERENGAAESTTSEKEM